MPVIAAGYIVSVQGKTNIELVKISAEWLIINGNLNKQRQEATWGCVLNDGDSRPLARSDL
jgi:hypothetical protein